MAVSKIRKISSWTLIIVTLLSLSVLALFFFGGLDDPLGKDGEWKNPTYTGEMLIWAYFLLGACALSMLLFGIIQFALKFKTDTKASLMALGVVAAFVVLLVIAYTMGDGTPLPGINEDSKDFNVESWLKITDMWLYSMYTLLGLAGAAMVWGAVKKAINK